MTITWNQISYKYYGYQRLGDYGDCYNFAIALNRIVKGKFMAIWFVDENTIDEPRFDHVVVFNPETRRYHDIKGIYTRKELEKRCLEEIEECNSFKIFEITLKQVINTNQIDEHRIDLYHKLLLSKG